MVSSSIFRLEWKYAGADRHTWCLVSYHTTAHDAVAIAAVKNARAKGNLPPWSGVREVGDKGDYTDYRYRVSEYTRKGVVK